MSGRARAGGRGTVEATADPNLRTADPREALAVRYFRLFNEIGIIQHLSANMLARVLPEGVSVAGFGVLNHFARLGGVSSPARLARAFQVTKGAMTNTLQRLEAFGLVAVRADPKDARGKLVEVTPKGLTVRNQAVRATTSMLDIMMEGMTAEDLDRVLPPLERLRKTLDENR